MKKGFLYIVSTGYDPEKGRKIEDPYLGKTPTLGACMPNIRRQVNPGDYIFPVSGKVPGVPQYIMGGFEVKEKIDYISAYERFPQHRLCCTDGKTTGNIIIDSEGNHHLLDTHKRGAAFERRKDNYIIGCNLIALTAPHEIARGRKETLDILKFIFQKDGNTPFNIIGRWRKLDEWQIDQLSYWLVLVNSMPLAA